MKDKFKQLFNLPNNGFHEPIDLTDTEVGFSVYKDRDNEGFRSLFRVYIENSDLHNPEHCKHVIVSVAYGKATEDGITISSSDFERKVNWPTDLVSMNDYLYNIETNQLYKGLEEITGLEILCQVDQLHTKSTRPIRGLWLRTKIRIFNNILPSIVKFVFSITAFISYLLSGNKVSIFGQITYKANRRNPVENNNLTITKSEPIDIMGYKVEPWIAGLYCLFHLSVYGIFYKINFHPTWLKNIFENNFLTVMYVIVTLGIFNAVTPHVLKSNNILDSVLKTLQKLFFYFAFSQIKI